MPEKDFYLIITLSIVIGFLLIRTLRARVARRRKGRRLEREIAEYLTLRAAAKE
jgi:hypothetical protein